EHLHFEGPKLADRIDRVGDVMSVNVTLGNGTVIHGDFVVAGSIRDSFNRAKQVGGDKRARELLEQLASQVGAILGKLQPDDAQKAADALESLTKEAQRQKPRREWWELSLNGVKEAAESIKAIGAPVVDTVKLLLPLFTGLSS